MLTLSQTAGYAILALGCLDDAPRGWVLAKTVVERTAIPGPYLSKILHALAKVGVVRAKRGYRGGFMLARPGDRITVAEIVDAVDGPHWLSGCLLGWAQCTDERACPAHALWMPLRKRLRAHLEQLTLAEVADFERRKARALFGVSGLRVDQSGPSLRPARRRTKRARMSHHQRPTKRY